MIERSRFIFRAEMKREHSINLLLGVIGRPMLVAHDGEWTRRIVGERGAQRLSAELKIPVYDVRKTGYPQRMRDFEARRKILERRLLED